MSEPDTDIAAIARLTADVARLHTEVNATLDRLQSAHEGLAAETATRAALRTQESRALGLLADAGAPVDLLDGIAWVVRERDEALAVATTLGRECASISEELGLPPTMRPQEGELRRIMQHAQDARAAQADAERLRAACVRLAVALSQIDYACGEPNDMRASGYDVHCDEEIVVRNVEAMRHVLEPRAKYAEKLNDGYAQMAVDRMLARAEALERIATLTRERDEARAALANAHAFLADVSSEMTQGAVARADISERRADQWRARCAEETTRCERAERTAHAAGRAEGLEAAAKVLDERARLAAQLGYERTAGQYHGAAADIRAMMGGRVVSGYGDYGDPEKTCPICGARPHVECEDWCDIFATHAEVTQWPVALGLAIRRCARRCEVSGLVECIDWSVDVMADPESEWAHDDARDTFAFALDRLAAMAKEGAER
jgi:hypothetical protein